jgi:hypothetical protein
VFVCAVLIQTKGKVRKLVVDGVCRVGQIIQVMLDVVCLRKEIWYEILMLSKRTQFTID